MERQPWQRADFSRNLRARLQVRPGRRVASEPPCLDGASHLRYQGKPLLRLLECYVLRATEELPAKDAQTLGGMAPKLRQIYNLQGAWWEIIEKVMALPPTIPTGIRDLWAKNQTTAKLKRSP
jgi:hypothetical protein